MKEKSIQDLKAKKQLEESTASPKEAIKLANAFSKALAAAKFIAKASSSTTPQWSKTEKIDENS